jgi:hypothetical protein
MRRPGARHDARRHRLGRALVLPARPIQAGRRFRFLVSLQAPLGKP